MGFAQPRKEDEKVRRLQDGSNCEDDRVPDGAYEVIHQKRNDDARQRCEEEEDAVCDVHPVRVHGHGFCDHCLAGWVAKQRQTEEKVSHGER